jgi:chromosome segregation ATPase
MKTAEDIKRTIGIEQGRLGHYTDLLWGLVFLYEKELKRLGSELSINNAALAALKQENERLVAEKAQKQLCIDDCKRQLAAIEKREGELRGKVARALRTVKEMRSGLLRCHHEEGLNAMEQILKGGGDERPNKTDGV